MHSRTRWFLVVFMVTLLILLVAGLAAADGGVTFLSDQDRIVTLPPHGEQPDHIDIEVKVVNGSAVSQDIHLDIVGPFNEDGAQVPPGVLPAGLPLSVTNVISGGVAPFGLTFTRTTELSETYAGQLVAYGDDGSLDRMGLTLTVAPATTLTPSVSIISVFSDTVPTTIGDFEAAVTNTSWAFAKLVAKVMAIILVILVLIGFYRLYRAARRSQLVFEDFVNASGGAGLDEKMLPGLSQSARERLTQALRDVYRQLKWYNEWDGEEDWGQESDESDLLTPQLAALTPRLAVALRKTTPTPAQKAPDNRLSDFLKSLEDVGSDPFKVVVQLVSALIRPLGTKVISTLLRMGDTPGRLGINFAIADMGGHATSEFKTIWKPADGYQEATGSGSEEGEVSQGSLAVASRESTIVMPESDTHFQQAEVYRKVADCLAAKDVGLYEDAIGYLEEALKLYKTFEETAEAPIQQAEKAAAALTAEEVTRTLVATVSKLQVQESGDSAYAVGRKLQDAGLLLPAVESYKKPLLTNDQAAAETSWKIALGLISDDEGDAYLRLAEFYRKDRVYLFKESLALYKTAIEKGSTQAVDELDTIQQGAANALTDAGGLLYGLAQYAGAEKYLKEALERVPNHKQAQATLAKVKKDKPPEENKDALALYTLGKLYEDRGALDEAKTKYEEALQKQPTYENARDALRAVLKSNQRTLSERYYVLLDPAIYWLAVALSKREMLALQPRIRSEMERGRYRAWAHIYFGRLYELGMRMFPKHRAFFNESAINEFAQADDILWDLNDHDWQDEWGWRSNKLRKLDWYYEEDPDFEDF